VVGALLVFETTLDLAFEPAFFRMLLEARLVGAFLVFIFFTTEIGFLTADLFLGLRFDLSAILFFPLDIVLVGGDDFFLVPVLFFIAMIFALPPSVSSYVASQPLTLLIPHPQSP
jgi:hypothetical protein